MSLRHAKNKPRKDDGAVLLTTLLVMSLMAVLAVAIMDDIRLAVKRAANVQAYAQADWYAKGAEEFAASYLTQQLSTLSPEDLNLVLAENAPIVLPIDGGAMSLAVRDGSHCFSLGALSGSAGRLGFQQLLTTLGWSEQEALRLTTVAADWQDPDSQVSPGGAEDYTYLGRVPARRTANTAFGSVTELRALSILSEKQYQDLRPFICSRTEGLPQSVNINTLAPQQAPLLAAILGGPENLSAAAQLLNTRPPQGYKDLTELRAAPALSSLELKNAQLDQISFTPDYLWIEAQISYQNARRVMAFEFLIEGQQLERLYKGFGEEVLRPQLDTGEL